MSRDKEIEGIITDIKMICSSVTERTYSVSLQQGHALLMQLYNLEVKKESVYTPLFQYHNSLEEGLPRDCAADILDYIVSWCSPQYRIWEDETEQ